MTFLEFEKLIIERGLKPVGLSYLDQTILKISNLWSNSFFDYRKSFYNRNKIFDPKFRILLTFFLVLIISFSTSFNVLIFEALLILTLILISFRFNLFSPKVFFWSGFNFALIFSFFMAFPSTLNIFTQSNSPVCLKLLELSKIENFSIFIIPKEIGFTRKGIISGISIFLRSICSVSIVLWLKLSMSTTDLFLALKKLRINKTILQIFFMFLIFLHILSKRSMDFYLTKKSRTLRKEETKQGFKWVSLKIARIWNDSVRLINEVEHAMIARGYRGE